MKRLRLLVAAGALVVLGACKVDVSVGIDAHADGTGDVRVTALLDKRAAEEAGDLRKRLRTDDLEEAGWVVETPERRDDGTVSITVRHPFDSPHEAGEVLAQLSGDDGPLRGFELTQDRSFFRTETTFTGTVDLARGVEAFSDPALQEAFGGQALGVPVDQLERRLGASLDRIFGLQVALRLPGSVESNAPTATSNGAVWAPKLGEQVSLQAEAGRWNLRNIVLLVVCVTATVALVWVVARGRRQRRPRHPSHP
ncbi:MAG TPA: hypothetical protein VF230_06590 [Acidimicrobiales bacterium]